ncbi:MAG: ThiF family adenylyltransferase [Gammaproteobacteria bacterium]|nr:ThiF family adenylyltransferase [Gammaproteobacteria bacterium]
MAPCSKAPAFVYDEAFSRNLGWLTTDEQQRLQGATVAIAGLGGVGGSHLLTLTRLGIGGFHLADFDQFELANFNRQAGARIDSIGQPKLDTLVAMALAINPELRIRTFHDGVTPNNIDAFIAGCDLYVDGLDFFVLGLRRQLFMACHQQGLPAVTAAPLGMGAALLCFMPGQMSFDDYFCFDGDEQGDALRFLLGLAPAGLHRPALVEPWRIDLANRRGPSTVMGCELCASLAASAVLKILLGRGPLKAAPWSTQIDGYRLRLAHRRQSLGHPLQRLRYWLGRRALTARTGKAG